MQSASVFFAIAFVRLSDGLAQETTAPAPTTIKILVVKVRINMMFTFPAYINFGSQNVSNICRQVRHRALSDSFALSKSEDVMAG